ncbi:protein GET1 isoform X3 [Gossypium raimondii]|uniref:Uncharacterized protein n=1 Tax=Gossypium raimondii TaxID=29730 RepID=A0A0D2RBD4_GOSRA|nr:protein GET1 isoform X3 [Gossypium raimondii]KJB67812.1 hypothetical protein B456_010G212400 [Gossypium raimondii]
MEGEIIGEGEILGGGEMPGGGEVLGGGEILERTRSLAAPFVFFIIISFQFAAKRLQDLKRGASKTDKEMQLRAEIKQLLKEAASYSQPSTFAQAAKLRRMAAAKEKELANCYSSCCDNPLVLELPCCLRISTSCATLWEAVILEDWGFFRQQCPGWDYTLVDIMFQS